MLSRSGSNGESKARSRPPANGPRLLIACDDSVLLEAMTRIVSWTRPQWAIEAAQGVDAVRRALRERAFDVLVCGIEPRAEGGSAMLYLARVKHPHVLRVACCTSERCAGAELGHVHELVAWPANVTALLDTLDRSVDRVLRGASDKCGAPDANHGIARAQEID